MDISIRSALLHVILICLVGILGIQGIYSLFVVATTDYSRVEYKGYGAGRNW